MSARNSSANIRRLRRWSRTGPMTRSSSLQRGGHDPQKVYNAYKRAVDHKGGPTVILAKTIKGYGLGSAQARNATHQEKKMTDEALTAFRSRFEIPIPDKAAQEGCALSPAGRQPGDSVHAGAAQSAGRVHAQARRPQGCARIRGPGPGILSRNRWKARKAAQSRPPWAS